MKKLIVLFAAVALVLSFAVTASADWNFFGSARMGTWWNDQDTAAGGDDGTTWAQQGNSRIGASVKKDAIGGAFEYGTGINMRKLYGTWNFGSGTLLVGQTYTPVNLFISNQVYGGDADLLNFGGGIYGGRRGMIQLSFGSFKIAFVDPSNAPGVGGGDVDVTLPKIEAKYGFKTDLFGLNLVAGYMTYEDAAFDVDAYAFAAQLVLSLGPAKINAAAGVVQNAADYGLWLNDSVGAVVNAAGAVQDEDTIIAGLSVGFKATDTISFEAGYSWYTHDQNGASDNDGRSYYVQAVISPAPGVYIIPEIGVQDLMDNAAGVDQGALTYFGAKWQINF